MSKILLIKPRFFNLDFQSMNHPIGLMYIGAVLDKAGHESKIHDCALDYADLHILKRTIKDWKPDFIGISIIITELEQTKTIMGIVRKILPDVPVTFGGPWPSANPEESIKTFGADFVVIGEGELSFPELIDAINNNRPTESIQGTASWINGNVNINQGRYLTEDELNALPFPGWDLLNHKLYAKKTSQAGVGCRPYMTIVTTRGCPYKCAYCHQTMGKTFRKRSPESVLAELAYLRFRHGFKEYEIADDCFNLDRKRMYAILEGIRDRIGDIKLHFPNGLRADLLEPEDMSLFKQAGTVSAMFAIETSTPRLQKMLRKNLNISKASLAINAAVKKGIFSTAYFMIGFPTETHEEALATVEFAVRSSLHRALFFNPKPFAGTALADMTNNFFKDESKAIEISHVNYFNSTLNISAMPDHDLQMIFRNAYRRFYLNPKRIAGLLIYHPRIISLMIRYAYVLFVRIYPQKPGNFRLK